MESAATDDEKPHQNSTQSGPVSAVVVVRALPGRESIRKKVIVSGSLGSAQDVRDQTKSRLSFRGLALRAADLGLARGLRGLDAGLAVLLLPLFALGDEVLADLVGVERARLLAVGLGYLVLAGIGRNLKDVVEGQVATFLGAYLIADTEDFAI